MYYAIFQTTRTNSAALTNLTQIAADLAAIRALHITLVVQPFPISLSATAYYNYLELARAQGLLVMPTIGVPPYNPDPADLSPQIEILQRIGAHRSVYAVQIFHEPHEVFTIAQMQTIYATLKAAAPTVLLEGAFSGQVNSVDDWAQGIVDVANINQKAFLDTAAESFEDGLRRLHRACQIIQPIDPGCRIGTSVQIWPDVTVDRVFVTAQPDEMTGIFLQETQIYPLKFFGWEAWVNTANDVTLNHRIMLPQRNRIARIAEQYL